MNNIVKIINKIIKSIEEGKIECKNKDYIIKCLIEANEKIACSDIHMYNIENNSFDLYERIKNDNEESFKNSKLILIARFIYFVSLDSIFLKNEYKDEIEEDKNNIIIAINELEFAHV